MEREQAREQARQRARPWLSATAALAAGLMLRLWFIHHQPRVAGDSYLYGDIAKNLLQHHAYGFTLSDALPGTSPVRPTLIRLPGYPLFIAACFALFGIEHYTAVMYVQTAVDLIACALAAGTAARLFGLRAWLPVLWLAALCPFTAGYCAAPLTETLSLATIALAFYGLVRWRTGGLGYNRWLWVIAAALSYALLLRPEQGLLAASVVPAMLWMSRRTSSRRLWTATSPVLTASLCVLLPLVPWTVRNWRTFHVLQPLAPRSACDPGEFEPHGFGRWYRTWAIDFASTEPVYWNYNGDRILLKDLPTRAFDTGLFSHALSPDLYTRTSTLLDDYDITTTATPAIDARFDDLAEVRIHASPVRYYLLLPAARTLDMAFRPRTEMMPIPLEWWKPGLHPSLTVFAAAYSALNFAYFLAAFAGLRSWKRRLWTAPNGATLRPIAWAMIASIVLRVALLLTIDNSEPRYTLEFFPILLVWSGSLFAQRGQRLPE